MALLQEFFTTSVLHAQDPDRPALQLAIPFELVSGFLVVVQGRIGNIEGLKLILDTGASRSVLDRKVADQLHLLRRPSHTWSFDKSIPVELGEVSEVQIGPLRTQALPMVVVNLAEYSILAEHIDGIVGLDILSRSRSFVIDYEKKTVSFQLAEETVPRRPAVACFVIRLNIQGLPVSLVVDTGFEGILLYQNRLRMRLPAVRFERELKEIWTGRLQFQKVRVPDVRLFDSSAERSAYLIDEHVETAVPGVDGFFGPTVLKAKRLEFDFANGMLRFQ